MAIVIYNDNGTIKVVKYGNYVVSTDADPIVEYEFYKSTSSEYDSVWYKFDVTIPELGVAADVMIAFKTQHDTYYDNVISGITDFNEVVVKANDGHGITYWKLREK